MTAVICDAAADRKAETWVERLAPFDRLEFAISDAAKGIAKAVSDLARARREGPEAPALEHGLDVFHTTMEARRVLAQDWRRVEAAWEKAEAADLAVARSRRQGIDARGVARSAQGAWGRATALFEQAESRLGPGPRGARPVPGRRPTQRPWPRAGRDRRGSQGPERPGLVEGPQLPE
jgi:hypothetical protein